MNINDKVKVTMTDYGLIVYRKFYQEVKKMCGGQNYWDDNIERTERVLETQLWSVMEMFGPATNMAGPTLFEGNEIEIIEE